MRGPRRQFMERVITAGDEKGRSFTGLYGDGKLNYYGFANVKYWPPGNEETGGFGFCEGGFYTHDRAYGDFLPFSPESHWIYAAWSGSASVEAYGIWLCKVGMKFLNTPINTWNHFLF